MNEKLDQYLNGVFAPYDGVKSVAELKADLLSDLQFDIASLQYETIDQRLRSRLPLGICIGIYYSNEL